MLFIITLLCTNLAVQPREAIATGVSSRSVLQISTQNLSCDCPPVFINGALDCDPFACEWLLSNGYWLGPSPESVSYTHLTLPTIYSV